MFEMIKVILNSAVRCAQAGSILFITMMFLASNASAQSNKSVHDSLSLNGVAAYWNLSREYYVAGLYLPTPSSDPVIVLAMDGPKRMEIRVTAESWSPRRFSQNWNQAISINNDLDKLNRISDTLGEFTNILQQDLEYGDRVQLDYTPGEGTKISINSTQLADIEGDDFFNMVLNAWIGARPPSTEFKQHILSLSYDEDGLEMQNRYDVIAPSKGRVAKIKAWKKSAPKKNTSSSKAAAVVAAAASAAASSPAPLSAAQVSANAEKKKQQEAERKRQAAELAQKKAAVDKAKKEKEVAAQKVLQEKSEAAKAAKAEEEARAKVKALANVYRANMLRLTYRHVVYPSRALDRGISGDVVMAITIDRRGRMQNLDFAIKANSNLLNRAAEKAVENAAPFPSVPKQLVGESFTFKIPIRFRIPE